MVQGLRTSPADPDAHVLFFDIESLIGESPDSGWVQGVSGCWREGAGCDGVLAGDAAAAVRRLLGVRERMPQFVCTASCGLTV